MTTTIVVGTADLRQALQSVAPHADQDADFPPLHRVRLAVDTDVTVSATDRYTAGVALVSLEDGSGDVDWHVDLSPTDVKEILALFRGKAGNDDEPGELLRIDVTDKHTRITDTSGLFEGKSLQLPRQPDESNFPNVKGLLAASLRKPPHGSPRLVANGARVALFNAAAKAYRQPLVLEPTGENTTIVISCGESFLGLLMPMKQDEETDARQGAWRDSWLERLELAPVDA